MSEQARPNVIFCLPKERTEGLSATDVADARKWPTTLYIQGIPGVDRLKIMLPERPAAHYRINLRADGVTPDDGGFGT